MTQKSAKSIIFYLLGIKNYTLLELRKKLTLRGFSEEEIVQAFLECQAIGYLNDEEEGLRRACSLKSRGYGPYMIREKLKRAGLKNVEISQEEQRQAIEMLLKKSSFAKKEERKKIAALQRRGFDLECIFDVLKKTIH